MYKSQVLLRYTYVQYSGVILSLFYVNPAVFCTQVRNIAHETPETPELLVAVRKKEPIPHTDLSCVPLGGRCGGGCSEGESPLSYGGGGGPADHPQPLTKLPPP